VIALDISPTRLALARHNAKVYGVADRIEFILADFVSFARTTRLASSSSEPASFPDASTRTIDAVFLSPPWGGPSYLAGSASTSTAALPDEDAAERHPEFGLDGVAPVHGRELFVLARRFTRNVAYYLPRNTRLEDVAALLDDNADGAASGKSKKRKRGTEERVEVEEEWTGNKLKALTCYFGGLVEGQAELW
jgi:trimethylguanosine synthase